MQPAWATSRTGLCRSHETWLRKGATPDRSYEQKIIAGLLTPTWAYMSPEEMEATINGRYRGDGRRLDQYITDEPMMIDLHDIEENPDAVLDSWVEDR